MGRKTCREACQEAGKLESLQAGSPNKWATKQAGGEMKTQLAKGTNFV